MSGIALTLFTSAAAIPANPLQVSVGVTGPVPLSINQSDGNTNGIRNFTAGASGGTPPYTYQWQRQNQNPKVTLSNAASQNGAYATYTNMIVGDYQSVTANCRVRDATGASVTSSTIVIGVRRDS